MLNSPEIPKQSQSVFLVETERIKTNPVQPRREFDPIKLQELAASIRAYGILQPLVVYRVEREMPTGATVEYELIAGERRLRASVLAGLEQVPVVIRKEPPEKIKLEMALVENIQREDLNPMERAEAYKKLADEFGMTQKMIANNIGKSRELVANYVRLISLPDFAKDALRSGKITEGHARSLLMLSDRPDEQKNLFEEMIYKDISVRHAEKTARRIAVDRIRKRDDLITDSETRALERRLSEAFGTRVFIERKSNTGGGRIAIDFFSPEDLYGLLSRLGGDASPSASFAKIHDFIKNKIEIKTASVTAPTLDPAAEPILPEGKRGDNGSGTTEIPLSADNPEEKPSEWQSSHASEDDIKNFTI